MFETTALSGKRQQILEFISSEHRRRGYPPSVREIGEAVGLTSSSSVHAHLAVLEKQGYLRRDPTKSRALEVRAPGPSRPTRHVPLVGDVAAGTDVLAQENIEEYLPLPEDLTGSGTLFMLRVKGDSMVEAGIYDGDYLVARQQPRADKGEIVVAGLPGEEATVKYLDRRGNKIILRPANSQMSPIELDASEVTVYGKVVTVLRRL